MTDIPEDTLPATPRQTVMVIEDDDTLRRLLADQIRALGQEPIPMANCTEAHVKLTEAMPDLMMVDMRLPDGDGFDMLDQYGAQCPIIFLTAFGSVDQAVRAVQAGALDYLIKPVSAQTLELTLRRAFDTLNMRRDLRFWQTQARRGIVDPVLGQSSHADTIRSLIELYAQAESPVLIRGESGTGKETVARAIHEGGARAGARFVTVDCDSGDENLMGSELFGHEQGAFLGADQQREGMLEIASAGTIYLNDIADLSLPLQAKLLRVMESGLFRRVGGARNLHASVRIMAASRRDLAERVETGAFRPELYYRLAAFSIDVPALRARPEDIIPMAEHFIAMRDFQRDREKRLSPETIDALQRYEWPGNLRELRNAVERAIIMSGPSPLIEPAHMSLPTRAGAGADPLRALTLSYDQLPTLESLRDDYLRILLERFEGNRSQVARTMGISERNTYRLIKKLDQD